MMLSDDDTVDASLSSLSLSICSKSLPLKGCILIKSARRVVVSTTRHTDYRSTNFWKTESSFMRSINSIIISYSMMMNK
jgi:hypothetical protein